MKKDKIITFLSDVASIIVIIIYVIFIFLSLGLGIVFLDSFIKDDYKNDNWTIMNEWEINESKEKIKVYSRGKKNEYKNS